jgi:DHA1 family multidrug resistance protein-like MFS transporter
MSTTSPKQTLWRLSLIVGIQYTGATLGLPLLPLYLKHRGGTPTMIGIVMASYFVAGLVTTFALGHLSDRFGRKRILVLSLVLFALTSVVYIFPISATVFAIARFFQGAASGAIQVVALASAMSRFPEHERGKASARILSAQLLGFGLGPLLGVGIAVSQLGWAFFATGMASLVAAFVAIRTDLGEPERTSAPVSPITWNRPLIGALAAAAATGIAIGVYETCWTLLLHAHHATTTEIRLSWTLFCIPWVFLARIGGWIADHLNRRIVVALGVLNGSAFLAMYPHIHNNVVMMFVGSLEAVGSALTAPAVSSMLNQGANEGELGRRQGLYGTVNTGMLALGAVTSGVMFSISPALPFSVYAVVAAVVGLSTLWWWRGVRGAVEHRHPGDH